MCLRDAGVDYQISTFSLELSLCCRREADFYVHYHHVHSELSLETAIVAVFDVHYRRMT